jgi:multidrug transporter EmrE-like cation transporter
MVFYGYGEYLSKKFALKPGWGIVGILLIFYSLGIVAWLFALLERNQLAIVGTLWAMLSILSTVCIGLFIFHEQLNLIAIAGIFTAGISIVLLSLA